MTSLSKFILKYVTLIRGEVTGGDWEGKCEKWWVELELDAVKPLLNGMIYPRLEAMRESLLAKQWKEYHKKVEMNEEGENDGFVTSRGTWRHWKWTSRIERGVNGVPASFIYSTHQASVWALD